MSSKKSQFKYLEAIEALRRYAFEAYPQADQRFDTVDSLEKQLNFSRNALHRAVKTLSQEGTLTSRYREGTYIHKRAPQCVRIPLALPINPNHLNWSLQYETVISQVKTIEKEAEFEIPIYYDIQPGTESFEQLRQDLLYYRVAGLLGLNLDASLFQLDGYNDVRIPRFVLFPSDPSEDYFVPTLANNGQSFWPKAISYLNSKGCKRIAVVGLASSYAWVKNRIRENALDIPLKWIHGIDRRYPQTFLSIIASLFDNPKEMRPDALIVSDDNLLRYVTEGIRQWDLEIGRDVEVAAFCNWPTNTKSADQSIYHIGADIPKFVSLALEFLKSKRLGEPVDSLNFQNEMLTEDEFAERYA